MTAKGTFPMGLGVRLTFTVHPPIPVGAVPFDELFEQTQEAVVSGVKSR